MELSGLMLFPKFSKRASLRKQRPLSKCSEEHQYRYVTYASPVNIAPLQLLYMAELYKVPRTLAKLEVKYTFCVEI